MGCCCSRDQDEFPDVENDYRGIHDDVYQDMTKPLAQYFISASHNSYCTGNQLTDPSGTSVIVQALQVCVLVCVGGGGSMIQESQVKNNGPCVWCLFHSPPSATGRRAAE
jgi:hypothetical protein